PVLDAPAVLDHARPALVHQVQRRLARELPHDGRALAGPVQGDGPARQLGPLRGGVRLSGRQQDESPHKVLCVVTTGYFGPVSCHWCAVLRSPSSSRSPACPPSPWPSAPWRRLPPPSSPRRRRPSA
ncbi:unnamed protein product, partial [Sphagnum tenellum]